jgi:serine phosphatase RsbU (regulator of sigma subunit)
LSSVLAQIQEQIENYATGAQQFDDITMLAVRRMGK